MERYIKTDILAKLVFDKFQECDELKHIIPAMRNAIMCASTDDVVDKERYDRVRENANILAEALNEYQNADYVEVVRCKDCVHHKNAPKTMYVWCECVDGLLPKEWFCADGERGTDDAET